MQVTIKNNKIIYGEIAGIYIDEFSRSRYKITLLGYNNTVEYEYIVEDLNIKIEEDEE